MGTMGMRCDYGDNGYEKNIGRPCKSDGGGGFNSMLILKHYVTSVHPNNKLHVLPDVGHI